MTAKHREPKLSEEEQFVLAMVAEGNSRAIAHFQWNDAKRSLVEKGYIACANKRWYRRQKA